MLLNVLYIWCTGIPLLGCERCFHMFYIFHLYPYYGVDILFIWCIHLLGWERYFHKFYIFYLCTYWGADDASTCFIYSIYTLIGVRTILPHDLSILFIHLLGCGRCFHTFYIFDLCTYWGVNDASTCFTYSIYTLIGVRMFYIFYLYTYWGADDASTCFICSIYYKLIGVRTVLPHVLYIWSIHLLGCKRCFDMFYIFDL